MKKYVVTLLAFVFLTMPALGLEGECINSVSPDSPRCLRSVQVAPYWVYSGQASEYVAQALANSIASLSIEVAPYWVYTDPSAHQMTNPTLESITVAPRWVYTGPIPNIYDEPER